VESGFFVHGHSAYGVFCHGLRVFHGHDPCLVAGVTFLIPVSPLFRIVSMAFFNLNVLTRYEPPKIPAMDSPNPKIKNERMVIQARTLFDTDFTSSSIGGLFFCGTASVVESLLGG
jgi:hypothetical protein